MVTNQSTLYIAGRYARKGENPKKREKKKKSVKIGETHIELLAYFRTWPQRLTMVAISLPCKLDRVPKVIQPLVAKAAG